MSDALGRTSVPWDLMGLQFVCVIACIARKLLRVLSVSYPLSTLKYGSSKECQKKRNAGGT
jgi:hypothetical protein